MKPLGAPILEGENLAARRDGRLALELPRFSLRAGEILGLIGPNGAGKSTLLLCLAGLLPPAQGHLAFKDRELKGARDLAAYRRRVTLVFQEPLLLDTTVESNIGAGLRLRGLERSERRRRAAESAERFGISHLLGRSARGLSGGEAQRTSLARAFVLEPQVLLMDEPFASLDRPTRDSLLQDLGRALRETRCAAVFATHDLGEALHLADTLAVLREGRMVQCGPVDEVVNRPADEFVAGFVGMETLLEGRILGRGEGTFALDVGGRQIVCAGDPEPGGEAIVGLRPEHVTLSLHPDSGSSARNCLPARVTRIAARGPFLRVELDCGFFLSAYVTARSREELGLEPGREVFASFKATALHLIRK